VSSLTGVKGDTEKYDLTVTDAEGDALDLTGCGLTFTIKLNKLDPDTQAILQKAIGTGITLNDQVDEDTKGTAVIALDPDDTAKLLERDYYYDVQLEVPAGDITTVVQGTFSITADVTRTS
jgi:hypothetical protein